jgi:hypothetical protein
MKSLFRRLHVIIVVSTHNVMARCLREMHPRLSVLHGVNQIWGHVILEVDWSRTSVEQLYAGAYIAVVRNAGADRQPQHLYAQNQVVVEGRVEWHAECEGLRMVVMWNRDGNYHEQIAVVLEPGNAGFGLTWVVFRRVVIVDSD